jgi:hypothetical protein
MKGNFPVQIRRLDFQEILTQQPELGGSSTSCSAVFKPKEMKSVPNQSGNIGISKKLRNNLLSLD